MFIYGENMFMYYISLLIVYMHIHNCKIIEDYLNVQEGTD